MTEPKKQQHILDSSIDIRKWDSAASEYSAFIHGGDVFRRQLVDPVVFDWLGDVKGKAILDAGCGEGYLADLIHARGGQAFGIDGSKELIRIAMAHYPHLTDRFLYADLRNPFPFRDGQFDAAVFNLVLMDFHPISQALHESSRVLKLGGVLIIALLHPFFASGKLKKTFKEFILRKPPHYRIHTYQTPAKREWRVRGVSTSTTYYHRPLGEYADALREAGFILRDIEEPVFPASFPSESNFMELCKEVPLFLLLKAEKISKT